MPTETTTRKRILFWNTAGSTVYALTSFLLLIVVVRLCGPDEGGVFSIGYAIAQLMLTVGVFECTTFFATDATNRFTYQQYLGFKVVTCILMAVASVAYITSFGFDLHKALVAYSLCLFRLFDALSQFWFAAFQKNERLDLGGFSTVCRSLIALAAFAVLLACTRDVALSMAVASVVEAVWIASFDIPRFRAIAHIGRPSFTPRPLLALLWAVLPLFVSSFLNTYLGNVCKYAIDAVGTDHMQAVFNILFMPSFVINLFVIFFVKPSLTRMANLWWVDEDFSGFMRVLGRLVVLVVGTAVVVVAACWLVGIPVLEAIYGVSLDGQLAAFVTLMAGGGVLSASVVFYNAMIVIRRQRGVLAGYVVANVVATAIAYPLVAQHQILGASIAYLVSCAVLLACFVAVFSFFALRQKRRWDAGA